MAYRDIRLNSLYDPNGYNKLKIKEVKRWFKERNIKTAVINISGGADSTYVAYLLTNALGKENVIGILQPNGEQKDILDSIKVVKTLGINYINININDQYNNMLKNLYEFDKNFKIDVNFENARINIAPRIRMINAYMIANAVNGAVVGTGNASERYVGYFTKWGDGACDYNPIKDILKTDLIKIGLELGIPKELICKTPADGLTGKSDEEKYGFTYKQLDEYIKTGECNNEEIKEKIDRMHENSRHKFEEI